MPDLFEGIVSQRGRGGLPQIESDGNGGLVAAHGRLLGL
jgi:hypothetical protein